MCVCICISDCLVGLVSLSPFLRLYLSACLYIFLCIDLFVYTPPPPPFFFLLTLTFCLSAFPHQSLSVCLSPSSFVKPPCCAKSSDLIYHTIKFWLVCRSPQHIHIHVFPDTSFVRSITTEPFNSSSLPPPVPSPLSFLFSHLHFYIIPQCTYRCTAITVLSHCTHNFSPHSPNASLFPIVFRLSCDI